MRSPRSGLSAVGTSPGAEGPGPRGLPPRPRRWSVLDQSQAPLDNKWGPPPAKAFVRPTWGETIEEGAAERSSSPSSSPSRQNRGNSRRGSMVSGPPGRGSASPAIDSGSAATEPMKPPPGGIALPPPPTATASPAPRRGSVVVAPGPATSHSSAQRQRGAVGAAGTGAIAPFVEEMSATRDDAERQRDCMAPLSPGKLAMDAEGGTVPSEPKRQQQQQSPRGGFVERDTAAKAPSG